MNPTPIIKDTCLLCGDGMTDDCTLCWKNGTRVSLRPAKRKVRKRNPGILPSFILCLVGIVIFLFGLHYLGEAIGVPQSAPAPTPAPALSTQALYESQIRDLTHEIHAREIQLDTLVRALENTAAERDAALNLLSQLQRGQGL